MYRSVILVLTVLPPGVRVKPANQRVATCLEQFEIDFEIRVLSEAVRTAKLAAEALRCEIGQIANSLIFRDLASDNAVLIMCAGDRRVDFQKVRLLYGIELGKADADFVRRHTGFAIGGVAPVAHSSPLRCLLDASLQRYTEIWAAAGTPESVFRMTPLQLRQITDGSWSDLAED